jgi:hypothetical protein
VAAGKLVEALRALCKDLEVPTPHAHGIDGELRNVMATTARSGDGEVTTDA